MINDNDDNIRREVHALYQQIEQEQPPKELDQAILNLAVANVKPKLNSQTFWRKYRWSLSSAASVLMVVTLFIINPQTQTGDLSDEAMPTLMMTPQDSPAPVMMRMASPEQALDIDMPAEDTAMSAAKKQQANGFSDNQNVANLEIEKKELLTRLDKVSEFLNRKAYAQAEGHLQQIKNDYAEALLANAQLNQRFIALEAQLEALHKDSSSN
ncbi:MAG: hypothetical protein ACI8SJ_000954 [Shewanella sp.]|jgi:hypothetical protein